MNNSQLSHVWANKGKERGRGNNMFFEGPVVYSYGFHFPIARHVTNSKGEAAVVYTRRSYSNTTAKHKLEVWRALDYGNLLPTFYGNPARDADKASLRLSCKEYIADAKEAAQKAKKSPARGRYLADEAAQLLREAARMSYFFKLGLKVPAFESLVTAEEYASLREKAETWESKAAERRAAANARRQAQWEAAQARREAEAAEEKVRDAEAFKAWRKGENVTCPWTYGRDENGSAYLRVKGEEVQTSQGAQVPLSHARRVFAFVKACKEKAQAWQRNGSQVRIGLFQVDSVTAEGNIRAGCHFITWQRIAECAQEGGFFEEAASAEALESSANPVAQAIANSL